MKTRISKKAVPVGGAAGLILAACAFPAYGQTLPNLLLNPGFESPSDPGVNNDYEASGWNYILDAERATFDNHTPGGAWSLWMKTFEGTTVSNPTGINGNTSGGIYQQVSIPVAGQNTNYTLSAYFLFEAGYSQSGSVLDLQMAFEDGSGFQIGNSVIQNINPTDPNAQTPLTWFPYSITGKAPSGTAQIQVEFDWVGGSTVSGEAQSAFVDDAYLQGIGTPPGLFQWVTAGSGEWSVGSNWTNGSAPNLVGAEADFFGAITANTTIALDGGPFTAGTIHFNNSNTYNLAGPYTSGITLQTAAGGSGLIQVDQGTQEIDVPLTVASNSTFNVNGGATLLLANPVTIDAGVAVTQSGSGTVTYQSIVNVGTGASLSIGNATIGNALNLAASAKVALTPSTGTPYVAEFDSLSLGTGATLDVANNNFVVNYGVFGSDPVAAVASYLKAGYNGGAWNGLGIYSSTVAALNASQSKLIYGVGYADGADGVVGGLPSGEIEIKPTLAGDAKLQGNVNFGDFQLLAANFGLSAGWDGGNFTYGSIVNFGDFQLLAQNFGNTASGLASSELASINSFAAQFGEALVSNGSGYSLVSVPEPASIGLVAAGCLALLGRRRKTDRAE